MVEFSPSLLAADFSNLREEIKKVKNADYLHLDVMDGFFVPNITFGPGLIKSLRSHSQLRFDTHLMIENPDRYIEAFADAGSDLITVHAEASRHLHRTLQLIKEMNCLAGVAINPATSLQELDYVLTEVDLVLIMSVNPGFGGQKFIPRILDKIRNLREIIDKEGYQVKISVDGGINQENMKEVIRAGADILVAGSAIFKKPDPGYALKELKELIK